MYTTVNYIDVKLHIMFKDGQSLDIIESLGGEEVSETNLIQSMVITESLSAQDTNPIGAVSTNTLELVLDSYDGSLLPKSTTMYSGMKNSTAIIKVEVIRLYISGEDETQIVEDEVIDLTATPLALGTYYVTEWRNTSDATNSTEVTISATDILSKIATNDVPYVKMVSGMTLEAYMKKVLDKLNESLKTNRKVSYNIPAGVFGTYNKECKLWNLNTNNGIVELFRQLSNNTYTNIFMSKDNVLTVSKALRVDKTEDLIMSDDTNLESISVEDGLLLNYASVAIKYNTGKIKSQSSIGESSTQTITTTGKWLNEIDLAQGTYKANVVTVMGTEDGVAPQILDCVYSNTTMKVKVKSSEETNVSVEVYGLAQGAGTKKTAPKDVDVDNVYSLKLVLRNDLIDNDDIDTFHTGVAKYIKKANESLAIEGSISPQLQLGDTVLVNSESVNVTGKKYIVSQLTWNYGESFSCSATLNQMIGD